ncbi:EAL domain-containing protein [Psychrobacillus sp. OK032]|uniref:bifunctional diguanylate cyclase/phosphodiesterase n=1 Tax=Psychrobacillus sp. OK032 TaxID=1884358 RepID=UPI0008B46145|nr:EAL domain-containing protein [Psychrobacillus sp. OK032]SES42287.1 diguanylate cyclase (GGDEF) domain-containing protein [Psychrobacillus sp. OK032]
MKIKSIKFWTTTLIVSMCIVTMSLFILLSYKNLNESLEQLYKKEAESILMQTFLSFGYQFLTVENTLEQLSNSLLLLNDYASSNDEIASMLEELQKDSIVNGKIMYGFTNGEFYREEYKDIPESYRPAEQVWYKLAMQNPGEVNWTEPYFDYVTQEIIITASKSVMGPKGMLGVIALDMNLHEMSSQISNSKIGEDGFVLLLSSNGTILANRDNHMIGETLFGAQHSKIIKDTEKSYVSYTIQNKDYIVRARPIVENDMSIVTAISKEEIIRNLINRHQPILGIGLFCLLLFGVIAYFATLRGVRPLKKLGKLMISVENGNYNVQANANDYEEIERLANGFNSMILAIKTREDKIKHLASYDSLTGLLNRRSLQELLTASLENDPSGRLKAVIFVDLDNFKTVNDTLGHSFGDKLIEEVAKKLNALSSVHKDVARISGDEFIVVMHDLESIEQARNLAEEIIQQFDIPITVESRILNVTASVGVSLYPLHTNASEELLKLADMAMYQAKSSGKNGYRIFDERMKQQLEEKFKIELGIRECLDKDGFELFFQPLFKPEEGRIASIEALLRTNSPALSNYNTLQIIQVAELTGQIVEIDKWVLKQACSTIQKINKNMEHPVSIAVNISAVHIMQQDFVDNIREIIEASGVSPSWIELEITETALMKSFDLNKQKLVDLQKFGISIHLDDFGTGYSSLSYLNSLPINHVKIDKSFVDGMLQSEKDGKFIETIINLAHTIGLHVVAEGVEHREQFEMLRSYNCELIQGYYISKPVSYEEINNLLRQEQKTLQVRI